MIVGPSMTIDESHRIADMLTCSIKQQFPGATVHIHIEPCNCHSATESKCNCFLNEEDKEALFGKLLII